MVHFLRVPAYSNGRTQLLFVLHITLGGDEHPQSHDTLKQMRKSSISIDKTRVQLAARIDAKMMAPA